MLCYDLFMLLISLFSIKNEFIIKIMILKVRILHHSWSSMPLIHCTSKDIKKTSESKSHKRRMLVRVTNMIDSVGKC